MGQRGTLDSITISIGGVAWDNRDVMLALCAVDGLQFDVLEVSEQILDVGQPQKLYTFPFDRTLFDRGEELGFVLVGHYVWIGLTAEEFADSRPIINSDPWDPPFEYLSDYNAVFSTAITPVPEPSTIALALVAIAAFRMRLIKRT
jgi:hypothetical protein